MWKKICEIPDKLMWIVLPFNAIAALLRAQYGEALAWTFSFVVFAELWALKRSINDTIDS